MSMDPQRLEEIEGLMKRHPAIYPRQEMAELIEEVKRLRVLCVEQRMQGIRDGVELAGVGDE